MTLTSLLKRMSPTLVNGLMKMPATSLCTRFKLQFQIMHVSSVE